MLCLVKSCSFGTSVGVLRPLVSMSYTERICYEATPFVVEKELCPDQLRPYMKEFYVSEFLLQMANSDIIGILIWQ
uniref:Uncharacterized protein n=1 Tax=Rhizophora mucronata TaxID=61149 RepID=A0A2P2N7Z8_RHIMU